MHVKKVNDVIGSVGFRNFLDQIPQNDPMKKEFLDAFKTLKEDCLRGDKIPHNRWPQIYIRKYKVNNLWRYPLRSGWRLVYTIFGQKNGFIVCVLEAFSHQEYEKRFSY